MTTPAFDYFINGRFSEMFYWMFQNYFVYGTFFLLLGLTIFSIIQAKTKNLSFSTAVVSLYFIVISPIMIGKWFKTYTFYIQVLLAMVLGYALYRLIVKKE